MKPQETTMTKITNTSKNERNPGWLFGYDPNAIEAQEARGQAEVVASSQLPTDIPAKLREKLEAAGVEFGGPNPDDTLFAPVKLPQGWKIVPTEHSMWTELVDAEGKVQASIFYKAAFYDRRAFVAP